MAEAEIGAMNRRNVVEMCSGLARSFLMWLAFRGLCLSSLADAAVEHIVPLRATSATKLLTPNGVVFDREQHMTESSSPSIHGPATAERFGAKPAAHTRMQEEGNHSKSQPSELLGRKPAQIVRDQLRRRGRLRMRKPSCFVEGCDAMPRFGEEMDEAVACSAHKVCALPLLSDSFSSLLCAAVTVTH